MDRLARIGSGERWNQAIRRVAEEPDYPRHLAQAIAEKPRALTPLENDVLLHDRMKLILDHREALAAEETALASGDKEAATMARLKTASIEAAQDANDVAAKRAGSESGASLQARQRIIAEDYSPLTLTRRAKIANLGIEPPPHVRAKLIELSGNLDAAMRRAESAESRVSELEARKVVKSVQKDVEREVRKTGRTATKQQLDAEFEGLRRMLARKTTGQANMGLDPEVAGLIAKMARNRVKAGVNGLGELVDGIYQVVRYHVEGIEPRDVRDAISGYGVTRHHVAQSEAVQKLAELNKQARLISKLEDLQAEGALPEVRTKALDSAQMKLLKKKLDETTKMMGAERPRTISDQARLAARKARIEKKLDELGARAVDEPVAKKVVKKVPDTAEIKKLQSQVDDLAKYLGEEERGPMTDAQRLGALKKRLAKRQAELEGQLQSGLVVKKTRRPLALDAEATAAQTEVNRLKHQADLIVRRLELKNRTKLEKTLDFGTSFSRAIKLSGIATVQKLATAASWRTLVFQPVEEAIGAGLSKTILRGVAKKAPIRGGGSLHAIAESYRAFFAKDTLDEVIGHLKMKEGRLDLAHSKRRADIPSILEYPAHVHAAAKTPTKEAGYAYAMAKQERYERALKAQVAGHIEKGNVGALVDPVEKAEMKARAYEYANRQIFLKDSWLTNKMRSLGERGKDAGPIGSILAAGYKFNFPIVKVPVNYAIEHLDYALGLPHGGARLLAATLHGLEKLPREEAEEIMHLFTKGSVGAGFIALGASGVVEAGGFYHEGEKRKEGDLKPGEVRIGGYTVPHLWLHHPSISGALQVGAEVARTKKEYGAKEGATGEAIRRSARGIAQGIPFMEVPYRAMRYLGEKGGPTKMAGEMLRGSTIPPDLQQAAKVYDQKKEHSGWEHFLQWMRLEHLDSIKRKPKTLLQEEAMGIPSLRQMVPEK